MKKKDFKQKKMSQKETKELKDHINKINEATDRILNKYKKYWDAEKHTWKEDFNGH